MCKPGIFDVTDTNNAVALAGPGKFGAADAGIGLQIMDQTVEVRIAQAQLCHQRVITVDNLAELLPISGSTGVDSQLAAFAHGVKDRVDPVRILPTPRLEFGNDFGGVGFATGVQHFDRRYVSDLALTDRVGTVLKQAAEGTGGRIGAGADALHVTNHSQTGGMQNVGRPGKITPYKHCRDSRDRNRGR